MTDKLVSKIDLKSTYLNVLTTGFVQRCFIPLHFPSEKETVEMAIASLGRVAAKDLRLMIVPTTLHLDKVYVSEALVPELKAKPGVEVAEEPVALEFDAGGNLLHRLMEHKAGRHTHNHKQRAGRAVPHDHGAKEQRVKETVLIQAEPLKKFCTEMFEKTGMSREEALVNADNLVEADLKGIDSHGVSRLPIHLKRIKMESCAPTIK